LGRAGSNPVPGILLIEYLRLTILQEPKPALSPAEGFYFASGLPCSLKLTQTGIAPLVTQEKPLKLATLVLLTSFAYKVKSGMEMVEIKEEEYDGIPFEEETRKKNLQRLRYGYRQIDNKLAYQSV
jgi:hypothetical protein